MEKLCSLLLLLPNVWLPRPFQLDMYAVVHAEFEFAIRNCQILQPHDALGTTKIKTIRVFSPLYLSLSIPLKRGFPFRRAAEDICVAVSVAGVWI